MSHAQVSLFLDKKFFQLPHTIIRHWFSSMKLVEKISILSCITATSDVSTLIIPITQKSSTYKMQKKDLVTFKIRDEISGVPITVFIGFKHQLHSKMAHEKEKKYPKKKGLTKFAQSELTQEKVEKLFPTGQFFHTINNRIASKFHQLPTYRV